MRTNKLTSIFNKFREIYTHLHFFAGLKRFSVQNRNSQLKVILIYLTNFCK